MNAELTKRLFKAIALRSEKDFLPLCERIIESEKKKGHSAVADELSRIIALSNKTHKEEEPKNTLHALGALPLSRRFNDPLVEAIPYENLRHQMILPFAVEERFQRIEKEFAARERLALYGLHPRRKILLYGQPGCGKTLGAERLAWNTGLPLVKVRFDAMISSYLGETATNLRKIFESVKHSPSVLFLDECDFIAKCRTQGNDVGEIHRIVNTLLNLLEEYDAPGLLVAATNLDKALDRAIFRRFDDVFEIPLPREEEVEKLLRTTLAAMNHEKSIPWKKLVKGLMGQSASVIVKIAQDSAKRAVLEGRKSVSANDLHLSLIENIGGRQ